MTIYLDAGHGGIDPVTQKYTTAPSKQAYHPRGEFHRGGWFYEGVKNRIIADKLALILEAAGHTVVKLYHNHKDTSLTDRTNIANQHWIKNGKPKAILISEHSDAFSSQSANGFSVFTFLGQNTSDVYADKLVKLIEEGLSRKYSFRLRKDYRDGEGDNDANFGILRQSKMPAILLENLFFTNLREATLLNNPKYQLDYCLVLLEWLNSL